MAEEGKTEAPPVGANEPRVKEQDTVRCPKCHTVLDVSHMRQTITPPPQGEYRDWFEAHVAEQQELPGLDDADEGETGA